MKVGFSIPDKRYRYGFSIKYFNFDNYSQVTECLKKYKNACDIKISHEEKGKKMEWYFSREEYFEKYEKYNIK